MLASTVCVVGSLISWQESNQCGCEGKKNELFSLSSLGDYKSIDI